MTRHRRPSWIEKIFGRLADTDVVEAAWGDLLEEAESRPERWWSRYWILLEGARLTGALFLFRSLGLAKEIREVAMDGWSDRRRRVTIVVGMVASLPAAVLVSTGLAYSLSAAPAVRQALDATLFRPDGLVFRVVLHPIVILGGLALAIGINLMPLLQVHLERQAGRLVGTLAVRLRAMHLAVAVVGLALLGIILAYAFTENFHVVERQPAAGSAAAVTAGPGWAADPILVAGGIIQGGVSPFGIGHAAVRPQWTRSRHGGV